MYWIQIDDKSSDDLKCISDGRPFVPKLLIKCIVCISRINFIICATFDSIIHKISVIKNWCNVININLICATFHLVHLLSTQSLKIHWFYVAYSSNNWVDPLAIQVNLLITIHMPHHSKASCLTVLLCMTSRCSQVVGMSESTWLLKGWPQSLKHINLNRIESVNCGWLSWSKWVEHGSRDDCCQYLLYFWCFIYAFDYMMIMTADSSDVWKCNEHQSTWSAATLGMLGTKVCIHE